MDPLRDLKAKSPALKPRTIDDVPGDDSFDALKSDSPFSAVLTQIVEADIPGVTLSKADLTPESPVFGPFVQNPKSLLKAGVGVYANQQSGLVAVFNPQVISRDEVEKVDQVGKLPELLPPFSPTAEPTTQPAAAPSAGPAPQVAAPRARAAETEPIVRQRAQQVKAKPAGPAGGSILGDLLKKPL